MRIVVQSPSRQPRLVDGGDALILVENSWNDFSYRTLYSAHLQRAASIHSLGFVKIMRRGHRTGELPLVTGEQPGDRLPGEFGSLGTEVTYYERIVELGANDVLATLRDIALDPAHRLLFAEEEVLDTSLHRDLSNPTGFYDEATRVVRSGGRLPPLQDFEFTFTPHDGLPIEFRFSAPPGAAQAFGVQGPSRRIVVLVGTNGVGKTRLLAQLARVAYAPPRERQAVADQGAIEGEIGFPNIVAVSYSAFDSFKPPKLEGDEVEAVALQLENGTGRYAYCGMRDLAAAIRNPDEPERLLSPSDLDLLFVDRLEQVNRVGRRELLAAVLAPVFREHSFARRLPLAGPDDQIVDAGHQDLLDAFLGQAPATAIGPLSSGHKIVLHMLTSLVATLGRNGLALIDEPETHLHPPLLAALMTGIRTTLERLRAYAIVATHSPVVAQETLASQVLIIHPLGDAVVARGPDIQTFGENTGTLTRELFGLHTGAADFRSAIDRLALGVDGIEQLEAILGEPLSAPGLAHAMSIFSGRRDEIG